MRVRHIAALGAAAAIATTAAVVVPSIASDAASSSGKISFLIVESTAKHHTTDVAVLRGAITGGGRDVSPNNGVVDTIHLAGGTIRVKHPNKDSKFSFKPNAKTCGYSFAGTGTYTVPGGTGKYKGVTGSGSYTIKGYGVSIRKSDGKCNFNSDAGVSASYVKGSGPVTRP